MKGAAKAIVPAVSRRGCLRSGIAAVEVEEGGIRRANSGIDEEEKVRDVDCERERPILCILQDGAAGLRASRKSMVKEARWSGST